MKEFFSKFILFIMLFNFSIIVKAIAPDNGIYYGVSTDYVQKIYGDDIRDRNGVTIGYINSLIKKLRVDTEDVGYLYSIKPNMISIDNNASLTRKDMDDIGYLYLIKNGYPNKNPYSGSDKDNYYVTQLAIWMYSYVVYGYNDGTKIKNTLIDSNGNLLTNYRVDLESKTLVESAYELYKEAKKAHDTGEKNNELNIVLNAKSNDLTKEGQYLISGEVSVTITGSDTYKVLVSNGEVVDVNNNPRDTFNKDEKFKIRLDKVVNSEVVAKVIINSTKDTIYKYESNNQNNDVMLFSEVVNTNNTKEEEISFIYQANQIEISNIDIDTNKELSGTTLLLKDNNDNVIVLSENNKNKTNPWVSTDKPYSLILSPGEYKLAVTIPSKGYALTKEEISFTVLADGSVDKNIIMKNKTLVGVNISNRDEVGDTELAGFSLEIHDSSDKVVEAWITKDSPHHVILSPGEYTLVETVASDGYDLVKEPIKFTVLADGSVSTPIIFRNSLTPIPVPITASTRSIVAATISLILLVVGGISLIISVKRSRYKLY